MIADRCVQLVLWGRCTLMLGGEKSWFMCATMGPIRHRIFKAVTVLDKSLAIASIY